MYIETRLRGEKECPEIAPVYIYVFIKKCVYIHMYIYSYVYTFIDIYTVIYAYKHTSKRRYIHYT